MKVLFAHPQALAQCRGFVERCFPKATVEAALSNSAAVEEMMGRDSAAAIGTRRAAEIYGAEMLAKGIQDRSPNLTRFVVLGKEDHAADGRRPDVDRLRVRRRGPAGAAGRGAPGVLGARDQPLEDRVAAEPGEAGDVHLPDGRRWAPHGGAAGDGARGGEGAVLVLPGAGVVPEVPGDSLRATVAIE